MMTQDTKPIGGNNTMILFAMIWLQKHYGTMYIAISWNEFIKLFSKVQELQKIMMNTSKD
jgi:hypothetical protein